MFNSLFATEIKYEKKGNENLVLLNGGRDSFIKDVNSGEIGYRLFPTEFIGANIESAKIVNKKTNKHWFVH